MCWVRNWAKSILTNWLIRKLCLKSIGCQNKLKKWIRTTEEFEKVRKINEFEQTRFEIISQKLEILVNWHSFVLLRMFKAHYQVFEIFIKAFWLISNKEWTRLGSGSKSLRRKWEVAFRVGATYFCLWCFKKIGFVRRRNVLILQ